MSEKEGGDSKFMLGFVVGFLAGVLIALGVGASLVMVVGGRQAARAEAAMREAEMLRAMAEEERALADAKAREAVEEVRKAKVAKEPWDDLAKKARAMPPQQKWKLEEWKPVSEDDKLIDRFVTLHNARDGEAADLLAPLPTREVANDAESEQRDAGAFLRKPNVRVVTVWRGEPDEQGKPRLAARRYTLVTKGSASVPSGFALIDPIVVVEVRGQSIQPLRTALNNEP